MRHFNKPSKSIPDQIALLQERGMVIENAQQATWALSHISYYRLRAFIGSVWMAAEFISFGLLSKLFSALGGRADRKAIARRIGFDDRVFQGLMHHLATVRNICGNDSSRG